MAQLQQNQPKVDALSNASKVLIDGGRLDKADVEGVEKTMNALSHRWNVVKDHVKERQKK